LPGEYAILTIEVSKALDGKPFEYYASLDDLPAEAVGVMPAAFAQYFKMYKRFQKFGLPHGKGWMHEVEWVLDFFEYMDDLKNDIEIWHIRNSS
jgi:hypothetical protein